jgi:hypothetical protein
MAERARSPKRRPAPGRAVSADLFEAAAAPVLRDRRVARARMFGVEGLRVAGKVFAMVVKGRLVAKLPAGRVLELVDSGAGAPFDPGHGRTMKEWVSVDPARADWGAIAPEALGFVASEGKGGAR